VMVINGMHNSNQIKYIVVDVETHDWKDGGPRNGRIVEIAWMLFDRDMKCIESKQYRV